MTQRNGSIAFLVCFLFIGQILLTTSSVNGEYTPVEIDQGNPSLTGVFDDYGVDIDGDLKFDYLAIDVQVDATQVGDYEIYVEGLNSTEFNYINVYNTTIVEDLSIGVHDITVYLSGEEIYDEGANGPYTINYVELYFENASHWVIDDGEYVYTTGSYLYTDFDAPGPVTPEPYLTDEYTDYGVDLNSNGRYEYLVIEVGFNATYSGVYDVFVSLLINSTPVVNSTETDFLVVGVYSIPVYLSGPEIYAIGVDGPYGVWEASIQSGSHYNYDFGPYSTGAYSYADFEAPESIPESSLTGVFSDYGVDNNGNGKFDFLAIDVEINVTTETEYYEVTIVGLVSSEDRQFYVSNVTRQYFEWPGIYNVTVHLSGEEIYSSGQNGPYTLWYVFLDSDSCEVYLHEPYSTSYYSYTDFDQPPVYPFATDRYSDSTLDTDSNGRFDYLVITVEINVTMASDITVTVSNLYPIDDSSWIGIENTTDAGHLSEGLYNISVYLPGEVIFTSEKNGPYNLWSVSVESDEWTDYSYPDYVTASYDYTQFEAALVIRDLSPSGGDILSTTDVMFIWSTNLDSTTEVFVKQEGGDYAQYTGDQGTEHVLEIQSLSEDVDYYFYVSSYSDDEDLRTNSTVQSFYIGSGIGFSHNEYSYIIDRDYNQILTIAIQNFDDESHQLLLSVESPYTDLILGFVGNGSIDRPVYVASMQILYVTLVVHAQDAMEDDYFLNMKLTNLAATPEEEVFVDYSALNLTLNPDFYTNFSLVEIDDDPHTLTKTFNLTNYGDTLTDLSVYSDFDLRSHITWDPRVFHLRLEQNQSVVLKARYNPHLTFTGIDTGYIYARGYNTTVAVAVTYQGDGELFFARGDASFIDLLKTWFCTNRPFVETEFSSLPLMGFEDDCAGMIMSVDGDVTIDGVSANPGQCVPWNSVVSTGDYGSAQIDLPYADTTVNLEKGSKLVLGDPTDTSWYDEIWADCKGTARWAVGSTFGRKVQFRVSKTTVVGVRGTEFKLTHNQTTNETAILIYEGNVEIFNNVTGIWSGMTTDPELGHTFEILRIFNETSAEFDMIFRNSTDYGKSWLINQTLSSSPDFGNISIAIGLNNSIFVTYDILGSIYYLTSLDNGTTWSSPELLITGGAKFPYLKFDKDLQRVQIHWLNTTLTDPEFYYKETDDNGLNWTVIKRAPNYIHNILDAYLEVDFGLYNERDEYREHDVIIRVNGHQIAKLNNTIPEGRYIFPVNPSFLKYTLDGTVASNTLTFDTLHLNGGHYVITAECRLIVRMDDVLVPIYAHSLEEADALADKVPNVTYNSTDLGVYANLIETPKAIALGEEVKLNATILNIGDNSVSGVVVQFYVDSPIAGNQIGADIVIPLLNAGENATVSIDWTPTIANTTYIFVKIVLAGDDYLVNNIASHAFVVQGLGDAPEVSVLYPNAAEELEGNIYITWSAQDPNMDAMEFALYYGDEGDWTLIVEHLTTTYYLWNTSEIENGQYKIRVVAADGFFSSSDSSDEFFTINNPTITTSTTITTTPTTTTNATIPWYNQEIFGISLWVWASGIGVVILIAVVSILRRKRGGG